MRQDAVLPAPTLGADLRSLRRARKLTLTQLAQRTGRSVGWHSQVERDLSQPSLDDLKNLAAALDVSVSMLFGQAHSPAEEAGVIVRAGARRQIGNDAAGLVEELLSPDLTDDFEMLQSTFQPHSALKHPVSRPTQEVGYILSGRLELEIAGRRFALSPGDSFRIRGEPFRWRNPHAAPAVVIWVIAPPVY